MRGAILDAAEELFGDCKSTTLPLRLVFNLVCVKTDRMPMFVEGESLMDDHERVRLALPGGRNGARHVVPRTKQIWNSDKHGH